MPNQVLTLLGTIFRLVSSSFVRLMNDHGHCLAGAFTVRNSPQVTGEKLPNQLWASFSLSS